MVKRRQKTSRKRPASSAQIRFTLVMIVLGALILVFGSVLLSQARDGDWRNAATTAGIVILLLAVGIYSTVQTRRG